jgi:hypothetical protein
MQLLILAVVVLFAAGSCSAHPPDVAADARSAAATAARAGAVARMDRVLASVAIAGATVRTVSLSDTCTSSVSVDSIPGSYSPTECGLTVTRVYGFDGGLGTTMTSVDHELRATGWTDGGLSMTSQLAQWHPAGLASGLAAVVYRSVRGGDEWTAAIGWARHPEPLLPTCQYEYHTVVIQRSCVDLAGVLRSVLAGHRYAMEFTVGGGYYQGPRNH